MAKLTTRGRKRIKKENFAIPEERKYPIQDRAHAANALARVTQGGTPEEVARVRAAVKRKCPTLPSVAPKKAKSSKTKAKAKKK